MPKIILASGSIERKLLLQKLCIPFETIIKPVDETPIKEYSFRDQLNDISMRKALVVMDQLNPNEDYIIIAADQNIFFNGKLYGKPSSIEDAHKLIKSMQGSCEIYSYVGNTILYISNCEIVNLINECDIAKMQMDYISDEELQNYLLTTSPLSRCAGINIVDAPFLHLIEGKMSTAKGMTVEFLIDMLSQI